ncbi:MAG TPA: response regulator transcription factor [Terriglobales bacterium]|nr:response regulator transcription factor [Terriglobales bacterium]HXF13601.1 response regulator transcription factor [Terriglobales bacterium]
MQILIVEDDQRLARQLKKGLDENGHTVSLAFDGIEGLEAARQGRFDVLVLDVMLPWLDGFGVVKKLRNMGSKSPILMLTARDSAEDIVTGLDVGADDYLTKPFALKVLLARLRALARRKEVEPRVQLQIDNLMLDPAQHVVTRAGSPVTLTRTEFLLLETLLRNLGRVMTRARLIEAVWGSEREVESNTLDVYVGQLRSKIEPAGSKKLIQTIRGVGYAVREEDTA